MLRLRIDDPETIDRMKECKDSLFPACLDKALTGIFVNKQPIISLAEKAGYEGPEGTDYNFRDIWELYLKLLSSLRGALGSDVVAVIESQSLGEIERMGCFQCPIYKMELERKKTKYSGELPTVVDELLTPGEEEE